MVSLEAKFIGKLAGQVALVTGASRGIGKGIASMLAQAGAIVYITGRKPTQVSNTPGSLAETADEIRSEGGQCIPVECDHAKDAEVSKLFDQIKKEQDGRLDILVNNAFGGVQFIGKYAGKPFFEQPIEAWDAVNNVGLRSNYICSHHAAQLMVPRKKGLIVNISSIGGLMYLFGPAYGVGKEGNDRMAVDMAIELRKHNVAMVSLWPGPVMTELINEALSSEKMVETTKKLFEHPEHATFTGKAIVALASDDKMMSKSGRILIVAEMGEEYGFRDVNGNAPLSFRQLKNVVRRSYPTLGSWIPSFLYIPRWMFYLAGQKL